MQCVACIPLAVFTFSPQRYKRRLTITCFSETPSFLALAWTAEMDRPISLAISREVIPDNGSQPLVVCFGPCRGADARTVYHFPFTFNVIHFSKRRPPGRGLFVDGAPFLRTCLKGGNPPAHTLHTGGNLLNVESASALHHLSDDA
jgi:hypothetical protein